MASPFAITDLKTQSGLSFAEVELPVEQDKNINRNPISEVTPYLPVFMEKSTSTHTHMENQGQNETLAFWLE